MTDLQAKLTGLRCARNSPSYVMHVISRYVYNQAQQLKWPWHLEMGVRYTLYEVLKAEEALKILLLYNGIEYRRLRVWLGDGRKLRVSYAGLTDEQYVRSMSGTEALRVAYTT